MLSESMADPPLTAPYCVNAIALVCIAILSTYPAGRFFSIFHGIGEVILVIMT